MMDKYFFTLLGAIYLTPLMPRWFLGLCGTAFAVLGFIHFLADAGGR